MKKRSVRLWGILLGAVIALTGCVEGGTPPETSNSGGTGEVAASDETIKVGILHSLSGTMAISEVSVKDAEMLAIEEINAAGGVLGKQIEPVIEDGASDWPTLRKRPESCFNRIRWPLFLADGPRRVERRCSRVRAE